MTEINGAKIRSRRDFALAARAAAMIGTWQAGYTELSYLGETTERIVRREALLGVSITGMMENPEILLDPALQREMAQLVKEVNAAMAAKIGISPAARTTCIKPAGSSSCLLGTSPGIHPHHARRYFHRMRATMNSAGVREFAASHPQAVEANVCSASPADVVLTFPVEAPPHALIKKSFRATEFLEIVRGTQQNWVLPGTRAERCRVTWLTNNVSNTVTVAEHEWGEVTGYLFDHRDDFTGVALLPASGDKDYPQAPMLAVPTREEIVGRYGNVADVVTPLMEEALQVFDGNLWLACEALLRGDVQHHGWVRKATALAARLCDHDLKRICQCLQDTYHEQLWSVLDDNRWAKHDGDRARTVAATELLAAASAA